MCVSSYFIVQMELSFIEASVRTVKFVFSSLLSIR